MHAVIKTGGKQYRVAPGDTLKVETLEKSAEWLTGEEERQGKLVQESELKLAQYKERQDAGALDSSQNIVVTRLTRLPRSFARSALKRVRIASSEKFAS